MRSKYWSFSMIKNTDLSLDDFKKWMRGPETGEANQELSSSTIINSEVTPKIGFSKLLAKIHPKNGDPESLAESFIEDGGLVIGVHKNKFHIEVNAGSFLIGKPYVELE